MTRISRIAAMTGMAAVSFFLCQPSHAETVTMGNFLTQIELPADNRLIRMDETLPEFVEVGSAGTSGASERAEKAVEVKQSPGLEAFGQELMALKFMLTCA